jgi:signal transduction histidine kinase
LRDGTFTTISSKQGLHDDTILRILEDDRGRFWMSTPRGVFRVDRTALDAVADGTAKSVTSVVYDKSDGLPTTDCGGGTQPSGWKARDGRMWFPTGRGVAVVDPAKVGVNATPPAVHIEGVLYDRIHPGGPGNATLPPGTKSLELHYTSTALAEPDRARFRYRLEPFDPDWVEAGARRVAYYTALRPGSYRFHVIAANESGVWNEEGAVYDLRVEPFFYETPVFFAAIAGMLAFAAWAAYRVRVRQIEARYAAVLSERGRIARELHDTIAQGFTGVSMQLEAVSSRLGDAPGEVRDNLDRARLLVRSSLADARRSVKALRPHLLESRDLTASLRAVASQLTEGTGVTASVTVNGSKRRLPPGIEDALFRVGQEAMTNAIRHGQCKTIQVTVRVGGGQARVAIEDDGAGFDTSTAKEGSGLAGMKERLDKLDGAVEVTSSPGGGTRVEAMVPV